MAIVKQEMSDWPGNDEKMTSYSNFKVKFSEKKKLAILKEEMSYWSDNDGKITSHGSLKLSACKRPWCVDRVYTR